MGWPADRRARLARPGPAQAAALALVALALAVGLGASQEPAEAEAEQPGQVTFPLQLVGEPRDVVPPAVEVRPASQVRPAFGAPRGAGASPARPQVSVGVHFQSPVPLRGSSEQMGDGGTGVPPVRTGGTPIPPAPLGPPLPVVASDAEDDEAAEGENAIPVTAPALVVPAGERPAPGARTALPGAEQLPYNIQLSPPGPVRLFGQLESEAALRERLIQEALSRARPRQIEFPKERRTEPGRVLLRDWPGLPMVVPPNYVCHKRLFFEQPCFERNGNNLGVIQPLVSGYLFYEDVFEFPFKWLTYPFYRFECHADGYSPYFNPWPAPCCRSGGRSGAP